MNFIVSALRRGVCIGWLRYLLGGGYYLFIVCVGIYYLTKIEQVYLLVTIFYLLYSFAFKSTL